MKRTGKRTRKHNEACMKYRQSILDEKGYISCESKYCEYPNQNFPPHSPHHIMSAGRYPGHEELHNPLNIIMLCHKCHTEFHAGKREDEYEALIRERGLNKIFKGKR